jgi:hypothetical protein
MTVFDVEPLRELADPRPAGVTGFIPEMVGHLDWQSAFEHRLGQFVEQTVRAVDRGVPDFTASLINESSVSAENVSANCRAADFSRPGDVMALVTNHSFFPPEWRSDDGPPRTYTDGMTRPGRSGRKTTFPCRA